jgi:hypothetical protein
LLALFRALPRPITAMSRRLAAADCTRKPAEQLLSAETCEGWRVIAKIFRGRLFLPAGVDCGEAPPFAVDELFPFGDPN